VEQAPESWIGIFVDGVDADFVAVEGELLEFGDGFFQRGERSHEFAVGRGVEEFGGALGGDGQSKGVKIFAVLDELIDVVDDVFGEW